MYVAIYDIIKENDTDACPVLTCKASGVYIWTERLGRPTRGKVHQHNKHIAVSANFDRSMTDAARSEWAEWMAQIKPMRSQSKAPLALGPADLQLNRALTSHNGADHVSHFCNTRQDMSHTPS